MAYFSNSSDGSAFDDQCAMCKYGMRACPIALVQLMYNYDACDNETATKILSALVQDDGTCAMLELAAEDLKIIETEENKQ